MAFLARTIARAKWPKTGELTTGEIPADAVTIDLRTQGNSLSFWQCNSDKKDDIEEAALAIASGRERIDKLDIVWLDEENMRTDSQVLRDSEGRTPVSDLVNSHVDLVGLNYNLLGMVAQRVVNAIEENRYRRLTKRRVKKLIAKAHQQGRISANLLSDKLRAEIEA